MADLPPSPYATMDPEKHQKELRTPDEGEVIEFYHPFVFMEGLAEVVRIHNPWYGSMDMVVVIPPKPTDVYVNSDAGEQFLRDRFPAVGRHRVDPNKFKITVDEPTHVVRCQLEAAKGPLRWLNATVRPRRTRHWDVERYESQEVWRSPLRVFGIDLRVAAQASGSYQNADGKLENLDAEAILYIGSFGRLTPKSGLGRPKNKA